MKGLLKAVLRLEKASVVFSFSIQRGPGKDFLKFISFSDGHSPALESLYSVDHQRAFDSIQ